MTREVALYRQSERERERDSRAQGWERLKCGQRHMRLACRSTSNLYRLLLMFAHCDIRAG